MSISGELDGIKKLIDDFQMNEEEISKCIDETFTTKEDSSFHNYAKLLTISLRSLFKLGLGIFKFIILCILFSIFVTSHLPTQRFILRHSQSYIYPIMRQIRLWSLPLINKYPHLTEYHEEECLIYNPSYVNPKLECWPCQNLKTLIDLTGLPDYSRAFTYNEKPFIVRDLVNSTIDLNDLKKLFSTNKSDISSGTARFHSYSHPGLTLEEFMERPISPNDLYFSVKWKLHRVSAARIIRKLFPRPYFVPESSEVSLQRYIFIDGPKSQQYKLPLTDFSNTWLLQGSGHRLIILDPSEKCRSNCSSISVLLRPKDVLYYNWQLYQPRSLSVHLDNHPTITYMGSFY